MKSFIVNYYRQIMTVSIVVGIASILAIDYLPGLSDIALGVVVVIAVVVVVSYFVNIEEFSDEENAGKELIAFEDTAEGKPLNLFLSEEAVLGVWGHGKSYYLRKFLVEEALLRARRPRKSYYLHNIEQWRGVMRSSFLTKMGEGEWWEVLREERHKEKEALSPQTIESVVDKLRHKNCKFFLTKHGLEIVPLEAKYEAEEFEVEDDLEEGGVSIH